jgi:hypothetical protein
MEVLGDHKPQDPVAEEFKTLIGDLCVGAGMSERAPKKVAIGEVMAQTFFKVR